MYLQKIINNNEKKDKKTTKNPHIPLVRDALLLPEMYDGLDYLKLPDFLDIDQVETFISGGSVHKNAMSDSSTSMSLPNDDIVFSQISPFAREIVKNFTQNIDMKSQ